MSNISAKKYQNLFVCGKVIASHRWDVYWDMVCKGFCCLLPV